MNSHAGITNKDTQRPKRILFTGGGGSGSEALSRLLSEKYEVYFSDADIDAKPFQLLPTHWHQIPLASSSDFLSKVQQLCQKLKIDLFVPTVDEELLQIAHAREDFSCDVLLPPYDFVKTNLDKYTSMQSLLKLGLPAPITELAPARGGVRFPCIVKPRKGRGSRGVLIVNSEEELKAYLILSRLQAEDFVLQELLQGQEYTVMMVANDKGQLRAVLPVKVEIKKGITIRAITEHDEQVIEQCIKIHDSFAVSGYYNIQLIKTVAGEIKPFEINPRVSTTACLGYAAGIDFMHDILVRPPISENHELIPFAAGLKLRRSWMNEFVE